MILRLAVLVIAEATLAVLLAVQVFAEPATVRAPAVPAARPAVAPIAGPAHAVEAAVLPRQELREAVPVLQRTEVVAKWNAEDPVGVLLTGTIRLRDGGPAADVTLSATLDRDRRHASAGKDGSYGLVGLRPGEWQIAVRDQSIADFAETVVLTDEAVQRRDFVVGASFPVRVLIVTPDGKDATSALHTAGMYFIDFQVAGQRDRFPDRLAPTEYSVVFVGDAKWDGEMNPKDGFAGTLHFASPPPAHAALLHRHLVLEQQVVQPGQTELKFVVDVEALKKHTGSATVRVLDDDTGAPLPAASVSLNTSNRGGGGGKKLDADGRATLEGLSPGLLRCQISAADHETMYTTVRIETGQRLDLGDVRLGAARPLTGKIVDADGKPAGGNVTWTELKWRTAPTAFSTNRGTTVEADGSFSLWGTGRGRIAVTVRTPEGLIAAGVFDNPPTSPVVLRLAKAAECNVTRPADPTRAFTVTLFDGHRDAIAAHTLPLRTPKYTISLPPGEYAFEVHDEQDRLVKSGALRFGPTPCTLEIR